MASLFGSVLSQALARLDLQLPAAEPCHSVGTCSAINGVTLRSRLAHLKCACDSSDAMCIGPKLFWRETQPTAGLQQRRHVFQDFGFPPLMLPRGSPVGVGRGPWPARGAPRPPELQRRAGELGAPAAGVHDEAGRHMMSGGQESVFPEMVGGGPMWGLAPTAACAQAT